MGPAGSRGGGPGHGGAGRTGRVLPVAGWYSSLHLDLGDCYRKLGDLDRAREHLRQARETIGALGDDGYGHLIKGGVERLGDG